MVIQRERRLFIASKQPGMNVPCMLQARIVDCFTALHEGIDAKDVRAVVVSAPREVGVPSACIRPCSFESALRIELFNQIIRARFESP